MSMSGIDKWVLYYPMCQSINVNNVNELHSSNAMLDTLITVADEYLGETFACDSSNP